MRDSGYAKAANDYYVEPTWLIDALIDKEDISGRCHDPSCGSGTIPKALVNRGIICTGSDIMDRGYGTVHKDFFLSRRSAAPTLVSNPPFGVMEEYIRHAIKIGYTKVIVLARLAFLEGQKRQAFFNEYPIARIWVSSRRASMPPGGTEIVAKGGTIAFAWFVFEVGYEDSPTLGWC